MKRIISSIMFLCAILTLMAQNKSFVVTDKDGNSQFVQSLIFQQDNLNDSFSWSDVASGYQKDADIRDLLFIARANEEMKSASADEVTQMLESLSGTDQADAQAIASVLQENPNVEEAYTADGSTLIVKDKGDDGFVIYPMYEEIPLFSELQIQEEEESRLFKKSPVRKADAFVRSVAIFNFFEDMRGYDVQNKIMKSVKTEFEVHGYDVEYYTPQNVEILRRFNSSNLSSVISRSNAYAAIIIISHGAELEGGKSYFCTGEEESVGKPRIYNPADGKEYKCYNLKADVVSENCIVYLGVCSGLKTDRAWTSYPLIGYSGVTRMAQANAAILFHLMLYEGYTLIDAFESLPPEPAPNKGTKVYKSSQVITKGNLTLKFPNDDWGTNYMPDCSVDYGIKETSFSGKLEAVVHGVFSVDKDANMPVWVRTRLDPILWGTKNSDNYYHNNSWTYPDFHSRFYEEWIDISGIKEGIYKYTVEGVTKEGLEYGKTHPDSWLSYDSRIYKPIRYKFFICSDNFKEAGAEVTFTEEDFTVPVIYDSNGSQISQISVNVGQTLHFPVEGYPGHSLRAVTIQEEIVSVSISGSMLNVTGISEGTAFIGVYDERNHKMAIGIVTVEKGTIEVPAEAVDLGLPSGTLWASCNVGANTPEECGDYFAWGETSPKTEYSWETYQYGNSSNDVVNIGSDIAGTEYDAATANWGTPWRMPTLEQNRELFDNCTSEWTTQNGVNGRKFTGTNGGTIFLPAAGYRWGGGFNGVGSWGIYWSSTPNDEDDACALDFSSSYAYWGSNYGRDYELSVRPVR